MSADWKYRCPGCDRMVPSAAAGGWDKTWIGHTPLCPNRQAALDGNPGLIVFHLQGLTLDELFTEPPHRTAP